MIKYADSKLDDYSISPKIRQILFHLGYELTEKHCWFNRKEIFQKSKERCWKNCWVLSRKKEAIKKKLRNLYKNLSKEEKDMIKNYQRKRYQQLIQYKKEALQNK